ncbi:MAG TPA: long-chain fatty acid--CoA ligase [Edaphocola sp.]|nr:long-chain fatty acid--CoA ligase [Edaphocola sp.]
MSLNTRLFDCLNLEILKNKEILLASKVNGTYQGLSTQKVIEEINSLTNGLLSIGIHKKSTVEEQDKIGIISPSRPEWLITDMAVQQAGAVLVPLYPNINIDEVVYIFNNAMVQYCFVGEIKTYKALLKIKDQIPSLKEIYCFTQGEDVLHWSSLKKPLKNDELEKINQCKSQIKETDIATIIYTSGTTGNPKGVMLSHKNIVSNVKNVKDVIDGIGFEERKSLSFLPLNHIYEKTISYIYLNNGISIYYAEGMETIAANLKEVRPEVFVTVPRLLEKVYEKIMNTGSELKGFKRKLFFWAVNLANQYKIEGNGFWYDLKMAVANKLIFEKWRAALGGKLKTIVVGGAACPPKLARIFTAAKIPIMEGYGLTESSPVISINRFNKEDRKIGTIGPKINNIEVKFDEEGELLCKGDNVMMGYYKDPEETAKTIVDGWLHTGDIGEWVEGKFLKITDRKKELFKNSGGKYIAPQPIENNLKGNRFIEQAMVLGANEKYVGALIVPNFEALKKWMSTQNIAFTSNTEAVNLEAVVKHYKNIIDTINKELQAIEIIKKFKLLDREFTVESKELTPKLSMRRKVISEHFKSEVEGLFVK